MKTADVRVRRAGAAPNAPVVGRARRAGPTIVVLLGLGAVGLCASLLLAQPASRPHPHSARVVLVSLDGMGTRLFLDDPVGSELRTLAALRARGMMADGLVAHMPSTTANTHAALWTGAWGDVNGISSNEMPLAPRAERLISARVSGYRSDALRAEPLWVTAARQGVRTVAQQATQVYPLSERSTGGVMDGPPILLHGYQAPVVAPARWLRASDLTRAACEPDDTGAVACFTWAAGPITFRAALTAWASQTTMRVRVQGTPRSVQVALMPTEHDPPRGRDLARHFSDGLLVDVAGVAPVMAYFRLFEAAPDGHSIVLFQSVIQEAVLYSGRPATRAETIALLGVAGGFVGNGNSEPWEADGASGVPLWKGGDGTRERRYLETLELGIRQTIRQARHLWRTHEPRLMIAYVSMPDEMDHAWLGQARQDTRYEPLRRWGYQLVDRALETYVGLTQADDHVIVVSDHGMSPVTHEVRVNNALRDAGLVEVGSGTTIDASRSKVLFGRNCLLVHANDWKGGVVPVAERESVIDAAVGALRAIRAPGDGAPIVTGVYRSPADRQQFGFGGPNGFDACIDLRPGYMVSTWVDAGPTVRLKARPTGEHGFLPTRQDMQGILVAVGPRLTPAGRWPLQRAIDVAPLVSDLLGIAPPRDARGRSPLR